MTSNRLVKRSAVTAFAATLLLLLAGCGSGDDPTIDTGASPSASASYGPAASGPHNQADVSFATNMIPHHAQAIEMADLAIEKAIDATVKQLAAAIQGAQAPEIQKMSGWLIGWGATVPSGMAGHSTGDSTGMGMMSDADMSELESASGAEFDRMWVEMMIEHHQGAVSMSQSALRDGQNAEVKSLAQQIITAQNREIATMRELLTKLPRS